MTDPEDRPASVGATETHHEPHDAADHAEHDGGETPGPVDVPAWTAGAIGILLGLIVVLCFAIAVGGLAG